MSEHCSSKCELNGWRLSSPNYEAGGRAIPPGPGRRDPARVHDEGSDPQGVCERISLTLGGRKAKIANILYMISERPFFLDRFRNPKDNPASYVNRGVHLMNNSGFLSSSLFRRRHNRPAIPQGEAFSTQALTYRAVSTAEED
jgi:hypothetical protein